MADEKEQVSDPVKDPPFRELGRTGLKHWGGVLDDEFLRELKGVRGMLIYKEMSKNDPIIGASLFAYTTLAKEVTFRVDSAKPGDQMADELAEFVRGCLFDDMNISWRDLLSEIFTFLTYGWSFLEIVYKRRDGEQAQSDPTKPADQQPPASSRFDDQKIGWRKWAIRGQDTLINWDMDDAGGIRGLVQAAAPKFERIQIPIEKALLFRTTSDRGSPEGVSILRTAYTSWYYKRRIQIIRGIGIERDLAGLPVLTPPAGVDIWNTLDAVAVAKKAAAEQLVRSIRRDEHEGVLKPFGWTLELLSSSGGRQFDITAVIAQLNAEMTISIMTDFLLVGHEQVGARSMREDARDTFSHAASSFLDIICDVINRFAIPRLIKINGWPGELAPKLAHGPVAEIALADLMDIITKAAGVGLVFPDEVLEKYFRERAQLPPAPVGAKRPGLVPREQEEDQEENSDEPMADEDSREADDKLRSKKKVKPAEDVREETDEEVGEDEEPDDKAEDDKDKERAAKAKRIKRLKAKRRIFGE